MAGVLNFLRNDMGKEKDAGKNLPEDGQARRLTEIPVDLISPNPTQPRRHFDEGDLDDLAASISQVGIIQPVVVLAVESGYELVVGERRLRAAKKAGLSTIPAIVTEADPGEQQTLALVENIHRSNLSAAAEAASPQAIMERSGWTHKERA